MTELAKQNYRISLRERQVDRLKTQRAILVVLLIMVALVLAGLSRETVPSCTDPNTGMPIQCQLLQPSN